MKLKLLFILQFLVMNVFAQDCNSFWVKASPDGEYLYFSSDRHGGNYEIYRTDGDGVSNPVRLTNSPEDKFYPSLSPDGSKIVFQQGATGNQSEIFMINSDGSGLTRLTNNSVHDGTPSFSPDGNRIVFDAWDASPYPEVFIMNADGSGRTQLTNEPGATWQSAPVFHPSGSFIYFSAGLNADNHFVRMNTDGTNWVNITAPNSFGDNDFHLQFNADGSKMIFAATQWRGYNNGSDLVLADSDGSNWVKLSDAIDQEYFYQAIFHPTEDKLYFSYLPSHSGDWSIHRMDSDGSGVEQISNCMVVSNEEASYEKVLAIYPNPAIDRLYFDYESIGHVDIFDWTGRMILTTMNKELDISGLSMGKYMVLLKDQQGNKLDRKLLIKQ